MKLSCIAAAVALLSAGTGAFAMETLSDDALSNASGQAGLTITTIIGSGDGGILAYSDTNGRTGTNAPTSTSFYTNNTFAGDLLAGFTLSGTVTTTIDVGATSASGPADLLVDISTSTATPLKTTINWLGVCATAGDASGLCGGTTATSTVAPSSAGFSNILAIPAAGVAISLGGADIELLLGATSAQHFITATLPSSFNLTIGTGSTTGAAPQLSLLDPNNYFTAAKAGGIGFSELSITPTAATTTTIDACTTTATATCTNALTGGLAGLLIQSSGGSYNIVADNVTMGNIGTTAPTAAIGNVAIYGFNPTGTSTMVSGH